MSRLLVLLGNSGGAMALLCAIHCALTPIVLTLFPALSGNWIESEFMEWAVLILSFLLGAWMMLKNFQQHKNNRPLILMSSAFGLFALNHLLFHENMYPQIILSITGGLLIIYAQVHNARLRKACACRIHS
ncbi:MAG: MerC domain-containing protein [Bacteroidia bacterium]|nr:MerC domain-containing protein [Bacteroidia bacterium]